MDKVLVILIASLAYAVGEEEQKNLMLNPKDFSSSNRGGRSSDHAVADISSTQQLEGSQSLFDGNCGLENAVSKDEDDKGHFSIDQADVGGSMFKQSFGPSGQNGGFDVSGHKEDSSSMHNIQGSWSGIGANGHGMKGAGSIGHLMESFGGGVRDNAGPSMEGSFGGHGGSLGGSSIGFSGGYGVGEIGSNFGGHTLKGNSFGHDMGGYLGVLAKIPFSLYHQPLIQHSSEDASDKKDHGHQPPILVPVPVKIPQPYVIKVPVLMTVEKKIEVPIVKHVPYPVEKPYPVEIIKKVPYTVPKPYPVHVGYHKHS